jgi:hypothetical protein
MITAVLRGLGLIPKGHEGYPRIPIGNRTNENGCGYCGARLFISVDTFVSPIRMLEQGF